MRPRGEVRAALSHAAWQLAEQRAGEQVPGATWRELAVLAGVGWAAAKATVRDMRRSGELAPVGTVKVCHARRPMVAFAPASFGQAPAQAALPGLWAFNWHGTAAANSERQAA